MDPMAVVGLIFLRTSTPARTSFDKLAMDHVQRRANDYISKLPSEILQQIVNLLHSYQLPAVAKTSRRFRVKFTC
jgi:hypothetical protein